MSLSADLAPTCADVAAALPGIFDQDLDASERLVLHIEHCITCQAELARYRRLVRLLAQLRSERAALPPGLVAEVLSAVGAAAERRAIRSALLNRRFAYLSGLGAGTLALAGLVTARRLRLKAHQAPVE